VLTSGPSARYNLPMTKGPKGERRPADVNRRAFAIMQIATGEAPDEDKNPHAVSAGRLGGNKGGRARAAVLTDKQRSEQAKKAAQARWKKD
jgi:hypothetical protein